VGGHVLGMFGSRSQERILEGNVLGIRQAGILTNVWEDEEQKDDANSRSTKNWPAVEKQ